MKIILKTTAGRTTDVEFSSGTTISQVKESLKEEYDLPSLRLCFQGKILDDAKVIDELGDGAALFIAGKKAALAKPAATSATSVATPAIPVVAEVTTAPSTTTATAEPTQIPAPVPAVQVATVPAPVATPAEPTIDEDLINNIAAMGFDDKELVKLALRAAYMNPDRAVDYLCQGMPRATLQRLANDATPAAPTRQTTAPSGPQPAASGLREALEAVPNFAQIRQVVQTNPQSLPTFMQGLQTSHPELFNLIQQNPQEFLALLQETAPTGTGASAPAHAGGPTSIELNAEDQTNIQDLVAIGGGAWDLQAAAIVYIAVNKNKEVAAAVLFEHGGLPPQLVQAMLDRQNGAGGDSHEDDDDADDDLYE